MNVLLGVTGSIAAYKAVDLMKLFQENGHRVSVVMTGSACRLIGPLTFETFSPGRVYTGMFHRRTEPLAHIDLCRDHELFLIAPATANIIGKMAGGIADDLLSTLFLAFEKKVIVAPAMNTNMYKNPAVEQNIATLRSRGIMVMDPDDGMLACKDKGPGKLPSKEKIYQVCMEAMND